MGRGLGGIYASPHNKTHVRVPGFTLTLVHTDTKRENDSILSPADFFGIFF